LFFLVREEVGREGKGGSGRGGEGTARERRGLPPSPAFQKYCP